jgi:6-phosphogluconolactonase (cycloisomerase 2 family)
VKLSKLFTLFVLVCQSFLLNAEVPGSFQQIADSPFGAGANPASSAYSPIVSGNLFAAIPNFGDGTVSVYEVNQTTGTFTQVEGSPFATGSQPAWQAFSPVASGNLFSAVANFNDNTVSVYEVNQATGAFTQVPGSPFETGVGPASVEFSPIVSGNLFAAIPNTSDSTVSVYEVNQTTGEFSQVPGSPFPTGIVPNFATFSPLASGKLFAAVANYSYTDNTVSVYEVNQATGAFTQVSGSPFPAGTSPYSVQYSPLVSGNLFAAVANNLSNNISVYMVDQTSGAFTQVPGSPFNAGIQPNELAFSLLPSGDLVAAVVNFISNNVSVYQVNQTTGGFTQVEGSPFETGGNPDGIAFSPFLSGNLFAAVANFGDNTVSVFQVSTVPPAPLPPSNFVGEVKKRRCSSSKIEYKLKSKWDPSPSKDVVLYRIFENGHLVDTVQATSPLIFNTCLHSRHEARRFQIVAVNADNVESTPISIRIRHH